MAKSTRAEHLAWCKERALEYVAKGDCQEAVNSMLSDLTKHPETAAVAQMSFMMGLAAVGGGKSDVKRFIEGFN